MGWRGEQQHQGGKHEFPGGKVEQVKRLKKPAVVKFMKKSVLVLKDWHQFDLYSP